MKVPHQSPSKSEYHHSQPTPDPADNTGSSPFAGAVADDHVLRHWKPHGKERGEAEESQPQLQKLEMLRVLGGDGVAPVRGEAQEDTKPGL